MSFVNLLKICMEKKNSQISRIDLFIVWFSCIMGLAIQGYLQSETIHELKKQVQILKQKIEIQK